MFKKFAALARPLRLALAGMAAAMALVVVPASPAAAFDPCVPYPSTPGMIDYKLELVDGFTRTNCNQRYQVIYVESKLKQYFTRTNRWDDVAAGHREERDANYAFADAFISCNGMGEVAYMTAGRAGAYNGGGGGFRMSDYEESLYRGFDCSDPLRNINP